MFSALSRSVEPWYVALLLANLVMGMSSILIPLKIDHILNLGPSELGILSTLASASGVVGSLMWGRLSDAVHRRKAFVIMSYLAIAVAHMGFAYSTSFLGLLVHNTILSFFWVANASVAVLLVIERTEETTWEVHISALNLSGAIGWLSGLVLGGLAVAAALESLTERFGMQVLFLGLAAVALVSAGLAAWLIPSTQVRFTQRRFRGVMIAVGNLLVEAWRYNPLHLYHRFSPRRLKDLRPETRRFLAAAALAFTGIGFFAVPLAMLLSQRLGYSPSLVFFGYVMLHSGIVLAYPFALHRIKQHGNRRVQIGALGVRVVLFAAIGVALWLGVNPPWILAAPLMFVIGVTWSFFQLSGVALASRLAKPENRGLALGTYNAIAGGSTMIAGVLSGYLSQYVGYQVSYFLAAALLTLAVAVLWRLPESSESAGELNEGWSTREARATERRVSVPQEKRSGNTCFTADSASKRVGIPGQSPGGSRDASGELGEQRRLAPRSAG